MRVVLAIVLLAAYALVHCAPRAPMPRSAVDESMPRGPRIAVADAPKSIEELQQRIAAILKRERVAGVAIALVGKDGPLWVGGVGVRDRQTGAPMDGETVFRVGSLSKSVIALGVMRLADRGLLDIDRPLREIVPDLAFENPWEAIAPVTLAQCLEHTAGFDDVRFNEIYASDERISVRDTLDLNPRSRRVRWQPGTRHAYSNVGYTVAARAIEAASGEPFDAYLRREILQPLGIDEADFGRTSALAPRLATGYMESDEPVAFRPFAHRPAGALLVSAADLAKLVHFFIVRGEGYPPVVSRAALARIERSGTLPYPRIDAEYGFANYGDVMHPVISRGHDGGMPGFHASFRYFSELGIGYAMALNGNYMFRGYFQIRALLFAYLTQGRTFESASVASTTSLRSAQSAERQPAERPGAGYFTLGNPRNEVFGFIDRVVVGWRVSEHGDHVHVDELQGDTYELVPTADGAYRDPHHSGSTVRFTTNSDGKPIMLASFLYAEASSERIALVRYALLGITMMLLRYAPLWAAAMLVLGVLRRRRVVPASLAVWPAIAGLCCYLMPRLLGAAFFDGVIGTVHPLTIALCGATVGLAVAAAATLVMTVWWSMRPDRPRVWALAVPMVCGLAFSGFAIWLGAHGWIGMRTWAW